MKKKEVMWLERDALFGEAISNIQPAFIGLDIGTGIVPHDYLKSVVYVCCEPFQEYVDVLAEKISLEKDVIYVIQKKNWAESISELEENSVDSVFLIDVIEHLPKEEGKRLLALTEKITRKQIVIFTPLGFVKQEVLDGGKDAWGLNGSEYQEHKSGWLPEDFDDTWSIYACKDFHAVNNIGEKLENPFGAFWAIKTFQKDKTETFCLDSISEDISGAIINRLPQKHFELLERLRIQEIAFKQLQSDYQLLLSNQQSLLSSKSVRYGNRLKKILRQIGIKRF